MAKSHVPNVEETRRQKKQMEEHDIIKRLEKFNWIRNIQGIGDGHHKAIVEDLHANKITSDRAAKKYFKSKDFHQNAKVNGNAKNAIGKHYKTEKAEQKTEKKEQVTEDKEQKSIAQQEKLTKEQQKLTQKEEELIEKENKEKSSGERKQFLNNVNPKSGWGLLFLFSMLLWISDYFFTKFNGFDIDNFIKIVSGLNAFYITMVSLNVFVLIAVAIYLFVTGFDIKNKWLEYLMYVLMVVTISGMFLFSRDFLRSPQVFGAFAHLIFSIFVLFALKNIPNISKAKIYRWYIVLLFFDFFLFSILMKVFGNWSYEKLFIVPFWVVYTLYHWHKSSEKRRLANFFVFLVIAGIVASNVAAINYILKTNVPGVDIGTQGDTPNPIELGKEAVKNIAAGISSALKRGEQQLNESFYYDSKDYYTGKVDQNVREPLGVYITNIETSDPIVYEDEEIDIWATLIAKSIEEPIETIKVKCEADTHTLGKEIPGTTKVKEFHDLFDDEDDIDCKFEAGVLEEGSHLITFTAEFDFTTLGYLKTYFIDDERLKAFKREKIDVFKEYGITDKNPIAIYTNGPVGIGMETKTPPIGVNDDYDSTPKFGITIENNWKGKIAEIKDLIIYLPDGLELDDYCDRAFQDLTREEYKLEGYKGYEFTKGIKESREWKNIEVYRSRKCRLRIKDPSKVLGDSPISIKYIKARIDYIYNSEEVININVKTPVGFNVYFEPRQPTIADLEEGRLKCIASHSDSYIIRAPFEIYQIDKNDNEKLLIERTEECGAKKQKCDCTIPNDDLKRGDKIKCKVYKAQLSKEEEDSDSAIVTIKNAAPEITGVFFQTNHPTLTDSTLECIGVITDKDNDDVWVTYDVKQNSAKLSNDYFDIEWFVPNKQFKISIDLDKLKQENKLNENDKFECEMTAIDDPPEEFERKESEINKAKPVIIGKETVTTKTEESGSSGETERCADDKGNPIREGKSCEGYSYKNCLDGKCVIGCEYLAKTDSSKSGWSCSCNLQECENHPSKCIKGQCPGDNYCCSPEAISSA